VRVQHKPYDDGPTDTKQNGMQFRTGMLHRDIPATTAMNMTQQTTANMMSMMYCDSMCVIP